MEEVSKINNYVAYKYMLFIMYNQHTVDLVKELDEESINSLLDNIKKFIEQCPNKITQFAKTNLYNILGYLRHETSADIETINSILLSLADIKDDGSMFLAEESIKRFGMRDVSLDDLYFSISLDFVPLYLLDTDIETFLSAVSSTLVGSEFYLYSLKTILKECPELFEERSITNRLKLPLIMNEEDEMISSTKELRKENHKLLKQLNRMSS